MAGRPTGWAYKYVKTGDPLAKLVLAALADNADDNGVCWPSQKNLAEKTELSVSTVKRKLRMLEQFGIVVVQRKRIGQQKRRNFYRLRIEKRFDLTKITGSVEDLPKPDLIGVTQTPVTGSEAEDAQPMLPAGGEDLTGVTLTPVSPQSVTLPPVWGQSDPCMGSPVSHEPPKNPQRKPQHTSADGNQAGQGIAIQPESKITISMDWQPNEYVFENLKFTRGVNREFAEDTLPLFCLHHNGTTARQSAMEKKFFAWVYADWQRLQQTMNEKQPQQMQADWAPSDLAFDVLRADGISESFALAALPDFRLYWVEKGHSRDDFNYQFVKHCRYKHHNAPAGQKAPAAQRLADRGWAQ